jgi:chemotaxis protein CheZ
MVRVTGELDAVVQGTLDATDAILTAAETIDHSAQVLEASCRSKQDRQGAADIQEQVVKIFEACNFQDLTGQRITKVVGTLKFIEDRIVRMMEIWGGIETFQGVQKETQAAPEGDAAFLNGPRLSSDIGHASQDDIDALFG